MKILFTIARILFAILAVAMLGFTIYFVVIQFWGGVVSCAALTAILGFVAVRDLRKWLAERKKS